MFKDGSSLIGEKVASTTMLGNQFHLGARFKPITPKTINDKLVNFIIFIGSLKTITPITAVRAVPRPLQSAYAVLTCQNFIAYVKQEKHAMYETKTKMEGTTRSNPLLNFMHVVPETSSKIVNARRAHANKVSDPCGPTAAAEAPAPTPAAARDVRPKGPAERVLTIVCIESAECWACCLINNEAFL